LIAIGHWGMLSVDAFQKPAQAPLPDFDTRSSRARPSEGQLSAVAALRARVPSVEVNFDAVLGAPQFISLSGGMLTGPDGQGKAIAPAAMAAFDKADPHRVTKAFLQEHSKLFGHGPEVLEKAHIK